MWRFLGTTVTLLVLGMYAGLTVSNVSSTTVRGSTDSYGYPYLSITSITPLSVTKPVPTTTPLTAARSSTLTYEALDRSLDARMIGLLLHVRWLLERKGDTAVNEELKRLDRQVLSLMDDVSDDIRDVRRDIDDAGGLPSGFVIDNSGVVTAGVWQGTPILDAYINDVLTLGTGSTFANDIVTPNAILSSGQVDEYCLTYEATGTTFEWQTCGAGSLGVTDIDTSAKIAAIVSDETGSGPLVFGTSPTFTGTINAAAATLSSTLTMNGTDANIALGANYLSGDGGDEGIFVDAAGNVGVGTNSPIFGLHLSSDGVQSQLMVDRYSNNVVGPGIGMRKARGTTVAPLAVLQEDILMNISGRGYDGTSFTNAAASVRAYTSENWSSGSNGAYLSFWTTQSGSDVSIITERMRIADNGNVGIGTTTPNRNLTLVGRQDIYASNTHLRFIDTDSVGFSYLERNSLSLNFGNNNGVSSAIHMRITDAGNVGIGTTSPYAKLSVAGDLALTGGIYDNAASLGAAGYILQTTGTGVEWVATSTLGFADSSDLANYLPLTGGALSGNLSFSGTAANIALGSNWLSGDGDDEGIFVDGSGNVGIGTASPLFPLQVEGAAGGNSNAAVSAHGGAAQIILDRAEGTSAAKISTANNTILGTASFRGWEGDEYRTAAAIRAQVDGSVANDDVPGRLSFITSSGGVQNIQMTIKSSGNVGIGTTSPYAKLSVDGNAAFTDQVFLSDGTVAAPGLSFATTNNLGFYKHNSTSIGYAQGGALRYLFAGNAFYNNGGSGSPYLQGAAGQTGNVAAFTFVNDTNTGFGSAGGDELSLITGGVGRLRISSTGNLGIGTTSPSQLLDVNGQAVFGNTATRLTTYSDSTYSGIYNGASLTSAESIYFGAGGMFFYTAGSERLRIDASGNVGIGTTTPEGVLELYSASGEENLILSRVGIADKFQMRLSNNGVDDVLYFGNDSSDALGFALQGNGNVGIGATTPALKLDILGDTNQLRIADIDTDAATKKGRLVGRHYTNAEEDIVGLNIEGRSSQNIVSIGGNINATGNAATTLQFYTAADTTTLGGSIRMTIDPAGNIGIGDTSPDFNLDIEAASARLNILSTTGTNAAFFRAENGLGPALFGVESSVAGTSFTGTFANAVLVGTGNFVPVQLATSNTVRMTIEATTGNIGIGTTTPLQKLQVFGDIRVGTSGSNGCIEDYGGGVIGGTCSSDERLKENIVGLASTTPRSYLEALTSLTPVTYTWNEEAAQRYGKSMNVANLGLIAQDVEDSFPELVSRNDDGFRQVDFRALPFYIIEAMKELWAKVRGIDERVQDLEEENEYLKSRLDEIEDELNVTPPAPPVLEENPPSEPEPEPEPEPAPEENPAPEPTPEPSPEPSGEPSI